ncbi:hypothetical protein JKP88DRAFT_169722 [Tribonema minus]|uniref:NADH-cytochrome b5 reductase n=1 Tax=Tribonema minus TaxID=303371 RepID=A0A836C990_9STRA|nr:hypothetical protein JKP88DRAFT_169722 [Tribonema minus]
MLSAAAPEHARDAWTRCALLRRERISRTAHRFTFAPADPRFAAQCLPGQHLQLSISDAATGAHGAARSFTPVSIAPDGTFDVVFRVYSYSSSSSSSTSSGDVPHSSTFTETLEALPVGGFIEASTPRGRLRYIAAGIYQISGRAQRATNIGFVAAGTGITPVYAALQAALGNPADATRFTLVYASRSRGEALLSAELEDAAERAGGRLRVVHVLSRDQDAAMTTTVYGRLDEAKLSAYLPAPSVETLLMVCGPPAMVHGLVLPALKSLQHDDEQVFVF